jgi:hypothetical protein
MNRLWWLPALGLALSVGAAAWAVPPEMDPVNVYAVSPQAGAWMIMAASYSGEDGKELARQLVLELRNKHRLPAYVWNVSAAARRQQEAPSPGAPPRAGFIRYQDEWAVLIGGYADLNAASAALPNIRKLPTPDLHLPGERTPFYAQQLSGPTLDGSGQVKRTMLSPFVKAMCVPNPTAPKQAAHKKFDPFWTQLNEDECYSLLKCRKGWTFAVKEYTGATSIQSQANSGGIFNGLSWLGGKKPGESIDVAGSEAHNLAEALHKLNFDAYVFHTRTSSIVTIGNFESPDGEQAQRFKQHYLSFQEQLAAAWAPQGRSDPLQLFPNPMPMEVPHP